MADVEKITKEALQQRVKENLMNAGIQEDQADYMAELYAGSEKGSAMIGKPKTDYPAATCSDGSAPFF